MFNHDKLIATIDSWITYLDRYTIEQLVASPNPGSWSIGQLYNHLIRDSIFYIEQAREAQAGNEHASDKATAEATEMFRKNAFPDIKIEGHASNAFIPNPKDQHELKCGLYQLQYEVNQLIDRLQNLEAVGKTRHPGLGYLNTDEWLQLMDIHFRHHLHQKKRIDTFLDQLITQ